MTVDTELTKSVETALSAFNEYKGLVESIKTKQTTLEGKLDAFDATKLDRITADIGAAIETAQKAEAKAKALEDQQKQLEAAYARVPAAASSDDRKAELKERGKRLFNDFARNDKHRELHFDDFVKASRTARTSTRPCPPGPTRTAATWSPRSSAGSSTPSCTSPARSASSPPSPRSAPTCWRW